MAPGLLIALSRFSGQVSRVSVEGTLVGTVARGRFYPELAPGIRQKSVGTRYSGTLYNKKFYPAFEKMGIAQLTNSLADNNVNIDKVKEACLALDGTLDEDARLQVSFWLLPRFPVTVQIWPGDEEIGGSANILFDASATHYLHIEDIVVAGDQVARFLILHYEMLIRQHN